MGGTSEKLDDINTTVQNTININSKIYDELMYNYGSDIIDKPFFININLVNYSDLQQFKVNLIQSHKILNKEMKKIRKIIIVKHKSSKEKSAEQAKSSKEKSAEQDKSSKEKSTEQDKSSKEKIGGSLNNTETDTASDTESDTESVTISLGDSDSE